MLTPVLAVCTIIHEIHRALLTTIGYSERQYRAGTRSSNSHKLTRQYKVSGSRSHLQAHQKSDGSSHLRCPTASPFLYHPVPCRHTQPQLLRSQSCESETAASNTAQVGMQKPETPFSQKLENEAWRAFVTDPPGCRAPSDLLSQDGCLPTLLVSPGVSQLGRPRRAVGRQVQQHAGKSPVAYSPDAIDWSGNLPSRNSPIVFSSDHTASEPSIDDNDGQNDGDLRVPADSRYDIPSNAISSQDFAAALKESNPQNMARNGSTSDPSVTSADDEVYETARKSTKEAINMSVLVMPSSADSSPNDMLNNSGESPSVIRKETATEKCVEEAEIQHHDHSPPRDIAEVGLAIERCSSTHENDLWRKFVFGESSDGVEQALEDARKQAARSLRPSITPIDNGAGNMDVQESCLREYGYEMTEHASAPSVDECQVEPHSTMDDFDDSSTNVTTTVPASCIATAGNSSPDPLAGDATQDLDTLARTDLATNGSSSTISSDLVESGGNFAHRSDAWSSTASEENRSSKPTRPQQTGERHRPETNSKFVQPLPFLGKKTGHLDEQRQISLSVPQVRGKNPTSRRRNRRKDGRTVIRNLPDFQDDPIEEFEDEIPSKGMQEHSLFGSLEVEKEF